MLVDATGLLTKELTMLRVLTAAGVIRPYPPQVLLGLARTLRRWGRGAAGGFTTLALRHPDQVGLVDELGELTFHEMHRRSNALARSLRARGVGEGDSVAVLCRNHRGFIDATIAVSKLGADLLYLNTAFAAPQLGEVFVRERPAAIVYDQEFTGLVDRSGIDVPRILAWVDSGPVELPTLEELVESGSGDDLVPPSRRSRSVILTSGTTGAPKGAPRSEGSFDAGVALLSRLPLRRGWRTHIAAPLFHTWGWAHLNLAMLLGSTMVLRRRFDPEDFLRTLTEHRCDSTVVIPVMLQRVMQLPPDTLASYDLSGLKVVAASGSALPGDLGLDWMNRFGDNLFNVYGSTEVAWVTIAQPADLRAAPGTAGRPPHATVVRLYDGQGAPVRDGEPGRIFVGNSMLFEGYSGGGSKDMVDGLMATGDIGRFDDTGLLFVEGRDDEMIVSGGENVFPQEVEDCLSRHGAVVEAAAVGVDDDDFGKRLRAFVVLSSTGAVTEDDLKDHVRQSLARYKVPRDIMFVPELPRNATGKILKRELAQEQA
jgi:acyl-CoA synthetase (AMP-forming)/AMP-acid ligase II